MEINFDQQQQRGNNMSGCKTSKIKITARNKSSSTKFVGVRQRPSGRWVAEIKDTTQKIRMWLGTFETAEEAARAYDEAACLLRGSNTRTNFATHQHHVSANSPLASRIRNLLNSKKNANLEPRPSPTRDDTAAAGTAPTAASTTTTTTSTTSDDHYYNTCCSSSSDSSTSAYESSDDTMVHQDCSNNQMMRFDDVYKPDLSNCIMQHHDDDELVFQSRMAAPAWGVDDRFSFAQELLELPYKNNSSNICEELLDFERMKVERQISASLYAINGLHEYMETVNLFDDPTEALWDLPPLSP